MRLNNSPWLHNFKYEREVKTLSGSQYCDVCVLGGGIAGVTTAFMLLRHTDKKIILIEGDLVAHGATGHNAGYIEAEFEKPFKDIVKEYGLDTARAGKKELDEGWGIFNHILEVTGQPPIEKTNTVKAFANLEHFKDALSEEYLKYGKVAKQIFLVNDCDWKDSILPNYLEHIQFIDEKTLLEILGVKDLQNRKLEKYKALLVDEIAVGNSALFAENLAKYCLQQYGERFEIYEKSFVHSIRLLQNNSCILDSRSGVCIADKVVLCTNGFENFDIFGPLGSSIDKNFHHEISGLIGYMMATFTLDDKVRESGGKFYNEDFHSINDPYNAGNYIYYTTRKFDFGTGGGKLISLGGPEAKLHDRKIYRRDHEFDEKIFHELEDFQREVFSINENPVFKWHGLMGYTKSGVRIVGQDKKFLDLYYNLGCNGIGFLPSIVGAKRIAQLILGKRFPPSIFDPK